MTKTEFEAKLYDLFPNLQIEVRFSNYQNICNYSIKYTDSDYISIINDLDNSSSIILFNDKQILSSTYDETYKVLQNYFKEKFKNCDVNIRYAFRSIFNRENIISKVFDNISDAIEYKNNGKGGRGLSNDCELISQERIMDDGNIIYSNWHKIIYRIKCIKLDSDNILTNNSYYYTDFTSSLKNKEDILIYSAPYICPITFMGFFNINYFSLNEENNCNIEISASTPINTTISTEEIKDIVDKYNINQLTNQMSIIKTLLSEYKDKSIKNEENKEREEKFMKVKNLMEKLGKMNPEAEVRLGGKDGEKLLFVLTQSNDNSVVWFEGEDENNMANEISTRIDEGIGNIYKEMIEQGIDPDMVRKYIGNIDAEYMEHVCRNINLL